MTQARLITLETWLRATYGADAPTILTARRWARDGHISPPAQKHGRAYFVQPQAVYVHAKAQPGGKMRLVDRIKATSHGRKAA